ncbi:MAG: BlaI/MecI/CopY family transcriptional regulator [bacterium]
MKKESQINLSRRERQIMDIIYQRGEASAADIMNRLPNPPSYSAVRAMLRVLEEKGHLRHRQEGQRYVFVATLPRDKAKRTALRHLLQTYFDGSIEQAVAALLDVSATQLSDADLDRLSHLIDQAKNDDR